MMRRRVQDESVAWFKLADLIRKKEKEKALNVYRLLSHSYENRAYVLQVEADILWALDDRQAFEVYKHAALLYKRDGAWIDAIAVCEHVLYCCPEDDTVRVELLGLYATTSNYDQFTRVLATLADRVEKKQTSEMLFEKAIRSVHNCLGGRLDRPEADMIVVALNNAIKCLAEQGKR